MADLAAVRQGIADAINALDGVTAYPRTPGTIHTPCVIVDTEEIDWRTAMGRGHDKITCLARVLIGMSSGEAAQVERDAYFGGVRDIKDAVESHVPLSDGTVAQGVFVSTARKFDSWQLADQLYLGVEILMEVYA